MCQHCGQGSGTLLVFDKNSGVGSQDYPTEKPPLARRTTMMGEHSGDMGWMPFGMGLWGILVLVIFVLMIAALVKYLRR
jgi:hypothetical protein